MKGAAILDDILCGSRGEIRYPSSGAMIAAVRDKAEWDSRWECNYRSSPKTWIYNTTDDRIRNQHHFVFIHHNAIQTSVFKQLNANFEETDSVALYSLCASYA